MRAFAITIPVAIPGLMLLAAFGPSRGQADAEPSPSHAKDPPWMRMLKGADAKKAEELEKKVGELFEAGKFADAIAPAREVLALRTGVQGADHWQTADAARNVRT